MESTTRATKKTYGDEVPRLETNSSYIFLPPLRTKHQPRFSVPTLNLRPATNAKFAAGDIETYGVYFFVAPLRTKQAPRVFGPNP